MRGNPAQVAYLGEPGQGSMLRTVRRATGHALQVARATADLTAIVVAFIASYRLYTWAIRQELLERSVPRPEPYLVVGVAFAAAILVVGFVFLDATENLIVTQFSVAERQDVTVTFVEPVSRRALNSLLSLPGVHYAEPFRQVPARLRFGHRTYRTSVQGLEPQGELRRLLDRYPDARAMADAPSPSGTPTISCAGRQSSTMRSSSIQGGPRSMRSVVSGDAVRVPRFAVAMPMRRRPKSNASRMSRSLARATRASPLKHGPRIP